MATPQQEVNHHAPDIALPFFWSATRHVYVWRSTGQTIAASRIREWIDTAIANSKKWALAETQALIDGRITFEAWITELRDELRAMHTALSEIAIGGRSQWGAVEAGRLGQRLRQQYDYLGRLGRDVESGYQKLDGTLLNRVGLFVESGRGTFEGMKRGLMMDIGMTEEMRVLHPAQHCADCPPLAGYWAEIGSLPGIGETACLSNDACTFDYRSGPEPPN